LLALFLGAGLGRLQTCDEAVPDKVAADINPTGIYTLASVDGKPVALRLNPRGRDHDRQVGRASPSVPTALAAAGERLGAVAW